MKRVTGIGGIFFQAKDPAKMHAWYKRHLGIDVQEWGGAALMWADDPGAKGGMTVWSIGAAIVCANALVRGVTAPARNAPKSAWTPIHSVTSADASATSTIPPIVSA